MNEEFNVVIAEDEKRICSLIKALIDWDGLHLAYAMCHLKHLTKLLEWNSRMVIS